MEAIVRSGDGRFHGNRIWGRLSRQIVTGPNAQTFTGSSPELVCDRVGIYMFKLGLIITIAQRMTKNDGFV